ncbi:MAG TPA: leucine-rich repeat protein, partial [Caproiciproducens sp.]|nr:leucine-rich repeat protein [Caproiciproducens sp.]
FPAGKSGTYAVPDSVTTICEGAFFTCESLTGVSFGSNSPLKVIDAGVFCNCGKLAAVTIPDNVTTIGASAFSRCAGLTDVSFGSGSHLSDIGQSAFSLCTGLTHVTIPAGVKNIGANAFANCTDLTAITIPAGVETIGNRAFNNCTGLTYVKFKGLVTSIGSEAFILESVTPTFYIPVEYHNDYVALLTENVTGSSSPNIADVVLVTAFDKLPADTEEQTVPVGTARSDLNLPDTLSATGNGSEELTINDVTWTENPAYEAHAAGTYLFTAKLPPNYELKDEGICPHITVKVAETGKAITSFAIGGNDCSINEVGHTIAVTVPYGTNVTALTPVIGVSKNASVSPASGIAQNFEKPVTYTVTAQNGDKQDYVVTVTVSTDTRNTGKKITSFAIGGNDCSINEANHTIAVTVPYRTNITALTPTITVSGKASVSPKSGIMQNFEKPVIYTVTAENGDTQNYVVTVTVSADTSHNSNQDNSKVNSSPTLPATVTDAPNGTAADLSGAAMPSGVTSVSLSTSQKSASDTSDQQAANAFRVAMTDTKLKVIGTPVIYDLKLLDQNGSAITGFTGKVKVKLPVPAGLRGMPHVLRYEESAGTFTDMNATVENGCLVFSTDHFSYYAVAGVGDSITLDTRNYQMSVGGNYQIGVKLTGNKAASVKIHSTNDKTATVTKLKNGNYQVNGKGTGTAYIMFDVYDNKNRLLTHASVKINVKEGSRPAGDSTRQIGVF